MNIKRKLSIGILSVFAAIAVLTLTSMTMDKKETKAYLEITLKITPENRESAAGVYNKYKEPFLKKINGAISKELLIRNEDVQVLHGFDSESDAKAYLTTQLFSKDVVGELGPLLASDPEVKIYSVLSN